MRDHPCHPTTRLAALIGLPLFLFLLIPFAHGQDKAIPQLKGTWTYRFLADNPDPEASGDSLLLTSGEMVIESVVSGRIQGHFTHGPTDTANFDGSVTFGNPTTLRIQVKGEEGIRLDLVGYGISHWPNSSDQQSALVGSVIQTRDEDDSNVTMVATWYAIRQSEPKSDSKQAIDEPSVDEPSAESRMEALRGNFAEPAGEQESDEKEKARIEAIESALKGLKKDWEEHYLKQKSEDDSNPNPVRERPLSFAEGQRIPAPQDPRVAFAATSPFQSPPEIRSSNGVLQATLVVDYTVGQIGSDPVRLRSYNGKLVGPTLRVKPGDQMRITVRNNLPPDLPHTGDHNTHHGWNTTNLHVHGLHVSPSGNSDNVLLEIGPGESQNYVIDIPEDHECGTFWYHAHKHGSVAAQVTSGMSGAIIIEGDIDEVTEIASASEKVFVLQQIPYWNRNLPFGVIELQYVRNLFGPGAWDALERFTTVNGTQLPVIEMQPGEVQRWRMVHSGFREVLRLKLVRADDNLAAPDFIPLHEIAVDGIPLGFRDTVPAVTIWPGNRSDLLIKAPEIASEYFLVDERTEQAISVSGGGEELKYVAKVIVRGPANPMSLPSDPALAPFKRPDIPASDVTGTQAADYSITAPPLLFAINGQPYNPSLRRTLILDKVDEWTLTTLGLAPAHPFHIHVNPFQVISMKDQNGIERLPRSVWRDTVIIPRGWTVKMRTRYERFTGEFVQHCHILDHEDQGMMELVEIVRQPPSPFSGGGPGPVDFAAAPTEKSDPLETATDSFGKHWKASELLGKPTLLVFYLGADCPHCNEQLGVLAEHQQKFKDLGANVVCISSKDDGAKRVSAEGEFPFPILSDTRLGAFKAFSLVKGHAQHGVVILNKEGKVTFNMPGEEPYMDIADLLDRLRQ